METESDNELLKAAFPESAETLTMVRADQIWEAAKAKFNKDLCWICQQWSTAVKMEYEDRPHKLLCRCCQWKEKRRVYFESLEMVS